MNRPAHITSPYRWRTAPCGECNGTGRILCVARVSGEAFDADWYEERCDDCGGSGEVDAMCPGCDAIAPLDDEGFCPGCTDIIDVKPSENGVWL